MKEKLEEFRHPLFKIICTFKIEELGFRITIILSCTYKIPAREKTMASKNKGKLKDQLK